MRPLMLSAFSSNVEALNEAWATGAALKLDRDMVLDKDIRVTIGAGRRLELFGGRIVSAPGSLILNAEEVASLSLAETVSQGDTAVTVDNAAAVHPGDLLHIDSSVSLGPDQWRMGDWGVVQSVVGNRLDVGWRLNWRHHPNRRLEYIADGNQRDFVYRLYHVPGSDVRVFVDGVPVDDAVEVTNPQHGGAQGVTIRFKDPPPAGARLRFVTVSPLPVTIYRGGTLHLHDLELKVDRSAVGHHHRVVHGTQPIGMRVERVRCIETNQERNADGIPKWGGCVFLQINSVGAQISDVSLDGGGYAIMIRGRDTHLSRVFAKNSSAPISSFHYSSHTHITTLRCIDCHTTIDGHGGSFVYARDVVGETVNGAGMRVNGGSLVDARFTPRPGLAAGIRFGVHHHSPRDEPTLADPFDNPVNMLNMEYSGIANDVLIQDVRIDGPTAEDGFYVTVAPAHQVILRNVSIDGTIDMEYGPIDKVFVHHLVVEDTISGAVKLRPAFSVDARRLTAGPLYITWLAGKDGGLRFLDCSFDASGSEENWIIDDRHNRSKHERRFVDCSFSGKAQLLASGPKERYQFINCTGPGL